MKHFMVLAISAGIFINTFANAGELKVKDIQLTAKNKNWQSCALQVAENIKSKVFADNEKRTFQLASNFKYRYGWDGYKFWFKVTETDKATNKTRDYFINARIKFDTVVTGAHSFYYTDVCRVDLNTGNPLYITDSDDNTIAKLTGKTLGERALDCVFDVIGDHLSIPANSGFFK